MGEWDDASGWLWLVQEPYKPVSPKLVAFHKHAVQLCVYGTGLEVSPCGFFENGIIQNQVGYDFPEAGVLLL